MRRIFVGSTLLVLCGAGLGLAQTINPNKLVDLTYSFNEKTIYWPNAKGFTHRKDMWKVTPQGYWYAAGGFSSDEHGGTHFDSPIHFGPGKLTLDQIPVERLVRPVVVIDVAAAAAELLVKRGVTGVGIDTASMDYGPSKDFIVHQILNGANIYGL